MEAAFEQKNTIIYGGAFNPPTCAHQAILQACIDYAPDIDADVWLLPSGQRADKDIDTSRERRLGMINALTNDVLRRSVELFVDTTEIDRVNDDGSPIRTETYDTVREFDCNHPDRRFIWVFGSDSVKTMPDWHEGEWLVDNLPMLIVQRPNVPVSIKSLGQYALELPVEAIDTSSTIVKERLRQHLPVDDLVPPSVLGYLRV